MLLLGVGTVLTGLTGLTGCTNTTHPQATPTRSSSQSATMPSPPSSPAPALPAVTQWQPSSNDIDPACKLAAVRRIEQLGNSQFSALQVIDAQYGGILPAKASVLVVTRSWHLAHGGVHHDGHTFDVRLTRTGRHRWRVTAIHPSHPGLPARHLTGAARRVLANQRIDLPPAARRDVRSGKVHDSVLRAMLELATTYHVGVSVVRSGHPIRVFGTARLSDHPRGRAFDTWRINRHPVVDPGTPKSLVVDYMHACAAAGSYNVGGPYVLGPAPQWFSDATHHDHVHAGFLT